MPAKDVYHEAVKNALIKDGWTIAFDPYPIKYEKVKLVADLAGEKTISATREERKIVIEIKSFLGRSPMREFETALGQYLIYRTFLSHTHPEYEVYLAIGKKIYEKFFQQVAIELILKKFQILLLIVDLDKEEISKWTS
ncbi:XisH family protein [Spirulina sp. 06S082]|uniref:XisH family protein n=1 Tax=Spirulina sp. 06S082 TaxID=3110248 RepID=UPI002B1FFC59|nr:XisH family protein [Spirulina sp. 06S082]MEA5467507.1 XisH family protein [Spirulina sp. 06S082]